MIHEALVRPNRVDEPAMPPPKPTRDAGIDALRFGCMVAVIVIHALPAEPPLALWMQLVWEACLPAVPFFFIASGYFLRQPAPFTISLFIRPLRRLLPIYGFWLALYLVLIKGVLGQSGSFSLYDLLLFGGPVYHLWFIPALAFALVLVGGGLALVGPIWTGLACVLLAGVALGRVAYHDVFHLPGHFGSHAGPLAAPLYVYIGAMIARRSCSIAPLWLGIMIVAAYGSIVAEESLVARSGGDVPHDVVLSTFLIGAVLFLSALMMPQSWGTRLAARLGRVTLGVYATHLFILWLLLPVIGNHTPAQVAGLACAVCILATLLSLGMQYVPALRSLVR